jgi:hypothetical protein
LSGCCCCRLNLNAKLNYNQTWRMTMLIMIPLFMCMFFGWLLYAGIGETQPARNGLQKQRQTHTDGGKKKKN